VWSRDIFSLARRLQPMAGPAGTIRLSRHALHMNAARSALLIGPARQTGPDISAVIAF